jgi:hypothetical protein
LWGRVQVHDAPVLEDDEGRSGAEGQLASATRGPAQRFEGSHDVGIARTEQSLAHGLSPASTTWGVGPELLYNAQLLTSDW